MWNDIAQRDLSKAVSLPSGLRLPKSFIEKDFKSFQNLKLQEKESLLKKIINAPSTPFPTELDPSILPSEPLSLDKPVKIPKESCSTALSVQCPVQPQTTDFVIISPSRPQSENISLDQHGQMSELLNSCHARVTQLRPGYQVPTGIHVLIQ